MRMSIALGILGLALALGVYAPTALASSAHPSADELTMPAISAFAVGTDINIHSVKEMETDSFNVFLRAAHDRAEYWTSSFIMVALRFVGSDPSGSVQKLRVQMLPTEWEKGRHFQFARLTVEDEGWLDDSVFGERYVIWLIPDDAGRLKVARAVWAQLCNRMYWSFYSADSCP